MNVTMKKSEENKNFYFGTKEMVLAGGLGRVWTYDYRIEKTGKGQYRVDVMRPIVPVWESIDGGTPVRTLKDARAMINAWHERRANGENL